MLSVVALLLTIVKYVIVRWYSVGICGALVLALGGFNRCKRESWWRLFGYGNLTKFDVMLGM